MTSVLGDQSPPVVDSLQMPRPFRVAARTVETHDVTTVHVVPADGGRLPLFRPAQFAMLGAFGIGEAAISYSSTTDDVTKHSFTIRAAGPITSALTGTAVGGVITVRGPFGRPWPIDDLSGGTLVVVGGGLGIAPLRAVIHEALRRRDDFDEVVLLFGARSPRDLVYRDELATWSTAGADIATIVDTGDSGWEGPTGLVTDLLRGAIVDRIDWPAASAFVCGPEEMMRHVSAALTELGMAPSTIWLTLERNMQCGTGLCGHCQLGPLIVCRDGPVVPLERLGRTLEVSEL